MRTKDQFAWFSAGLGVGIAASVLFAPMNGSQTRGRIRTAAGRTRDFVVERAEQLGEAARDALGEMGTRVSEFSQRNYSMNDLRDKAKDKIDDAADAAKKAADQAAEKARDLAHKTGKTVEEGGKRLQQV